MNGLIDMNIKHYILLPISALMLASCASDEATNNAPSADDRLPLRFATSLSTEHPLTRAYDNTIEATDELLSYVRHVYDNGGARTSVQASLVTIKDNQPTTALYWDDFSHSNSTDTDLRIAGHALQSYYGYCYNGGTPTTALDEETGELGWTIAADQTTAEAVKTNDLLWSKEQTPVEYKHAKDDHGTINVPYTHAMSKFTVVVVAGDGFKTDDLTTATVTLHDMNLKGTFTAPTAEVVAEGTTEVKMHGNAASTTTDKKPCRAFEAVVVPTTSLAKDNLATITMAGNTYQVKVSDKMLTEWTTGITDGKSQSGVNYKLTITLNKQAIAINATLAGWTDVAATGTGEIQFANDVTEVGANDASLKSGDAFRLYWQESNATEGYVYATTATYDGDSKTFTNIPAIYWPNDSDSYYFRALSGTDVTNVAQGKDVLWGTSGDEAIAPRTGTVPLTFSHAMSKVKVVLETSDNEKSKVDFTDAAIKMTQITTDGSIDIATGAVSAGSTTTDVTIAGETIMVPQTISADAKIVITLQDGTTYSLALKGITDIVEWKRGESYTYTIHVEKEAVKFRAVITPWKEEKGSGNASLDWD